MKLDNRKPLREIVGAFQLFGAAEQPATKSTIVTR
jgi:hypothetical protein